MKSKEVLNFLKISRVTLTKYVKNGTIKVTKLDNGYYDYDNESVFKFAKKDIRYNYIYARVSTYKQKSDLENQIQLIQKYCNNNNIYITKTFSEISSGIDFDRKEFSLLLNDIMAYKVNSIYISNKDRISRLSFKTLQNIFLKFGTKIIVINDINTQDNDELLEELLNLIHYFSTKMYSQQKHINVKTIKNNIK
jgi:predicted site-specific integrase-resolvase